MLFLAVAAFFAAAGPSLLLGQSTLILRGSVIDSETKSPLGAANIRVLGSSRGTITNGQGAYVLPLDSGAAYTIVYSYLAYAPETLRAHIDHMLTHDVALVPSPIQLPGVLALAEDPALEIIRKAIATKHSWMDKLHTYTFDAFTRQVLRRDTAIASITESYTTGFMNAGDTLREIIRQRRQTENIPMGENLAAVRRIANFNEDQIRLFSLRTGSRSSGITFVGPTAPDALDNYDYRLLKTATVRGIELYTIRMTPKSRLKPLLDGVITIADRTFAVVDVDVRPNDALTIPFVRDISLRYRQQFALYDSAYWMPADIRIDGGFNVGIVGISLPRIGISATSAIYNYRINVPLPDSMLGKRRLTVDSSAVRYDTSFWRTHEVLPLTAEEQSAYARLDSTQTLEKQFEPKGPLMALAENGAGTLLDYLDLRFNRVEGFYLGGKGDFRFRNLRFEASLGRGLASRRTSYGASLQWHPDSTGRLRFGGEIYDRVENVPDEGYYGPASISIMALIDKNDYRDYFLAKGYRFSARMRPTRLFNEARVTFTSEQEYSLDAQTDYSLLSRSKSYRVNPPVIDGLLRSLQLDLRIGDEPEMLDLVSRNAAELSIERSAPAIGSTFDFTRARALAVWSVPTFATSLLFSPALRVQISSGLGAGDLPPQRLFALDSRASGYASFGVLHAAGVKEFSGDRFVMINLEHNFRSVPFLILDIPWLYRNGIELLVHGSAAQTWNGPASTSGGWYSEAGFGVSRIFDIVRTDLTYRFSEPRRWFVTVSLATLL